MNNIFFGAEIGINFAFGKDKDKFLQNAKSMIDMVCLACDLANVSRGRVCVKFQRRTPELCVPEHEKNKEKIVPWRSEPTTYLQYKNDIELSQKDYIEIDKYCKSKGINWSASVWDIPSAEFITRFDVPFIKVPSALITNNELIGYLSVCGKPLIISTGMSTEEEIIKCVELIEKGDCPDLTILHCNSSYPASQDELDLNYIERLKKLFPNYKIGFSGHHEGISPDMVAKSLGAEFIERHVTLSRSNWGTDQSSSLVFDQLFRLIRDLNNVNSWLGKKEKIIHDSEIPIRKKLRG